MVNIVIIGIVAFIVGLAGGYIYKQRKRGVKCIGCPEGCSCSGGCSGGCGSCSGCGK